MASAFYNTFKKNIGSIDWSDTTTTTIKILLVTDAYALDIDLHANLSDITEEVVGTGYTAGGKELINRTITQDNTTDVAKYDATDVNWEFSSMTARGAVVYLDTGVDTTSKLIAYIDFGSNKTSSNGDFILQFNVDGVFKIA